MLFINIARISGWVGLAYAVLLFVSAQDILSQNPDLIEDASYMTKKVINPIVGVVATSILLGAVGEIGKLVAGSNKQPTD